MGCVGNCGCGRDGCGGDVGCGQDDGISDWGVYGGVGALRCGILLVTMIVERGIYDSPRAPDFA
jgi:hypothetical protein